MKKIYSLLFFLLGSALFYGCTNSSNSAQNVNQNQVQNQNSNQQANMGQRPGWEENFLQASSTDIVVGSQIMAMGIGNDDGTVSADRIMIANSAADFEEIGRNFGPQASSSDQVINRQDSNVPAPSAGQRPDFQNMTDEQRAQLREQMAQGGGGARNFQGRTAGQSAARIQGEVVTKDETSLTVKLSGGGSKLIFISDSTVFSKIK